MPKIEVSSEDWERMAVELAMADGEQPLAYWQAIKSKLHYGINPLDYLQRITRQREQVRAYSILYNINRINFDESYVGRSFTFSDIVLTGNTDGSFILTIAHKSIYEATITREKLKLSLAHKSKEISYCLALRPNLTPPESADKSGYFASVDQFVDFMCFITGWLKKLISEEEYHDRLSEIVTFFTAYVEDFKNGFPGGNLYVRENYPVFVQFPEFSQYPSKKELALYKAACLADSETVHELLREGVNPNARVSCAHSILGAVCELASATQILPLAPENILETVRLLIRYGADINEKGMMGLRLNAEHEAVGSSMVYGADTALFMEIIRLIKASRTANPVIQVHPSHRVERVANEVHTGNNELIERKNRQQPNIFGAAAVEDGPEVKVEFSGVKHQTLTVETKRMKQLSLSEAKKLLDIFRQYFKLNITMTLKGLWSCFLGMLTKPRGDRYIDLIKVEGKICAFNVATIYKTGIQDKPVVIHYVDLAIATKGLKDYKRFMTEITHARGEMLRRLNPEAQVFTAFSAITFYAMSQMNGVAYFPKYTEHASIAEEIANVVSPGTDIVKTEDGTLLKRSTLIPYADARYKRRRHFQTAAELEHEFYDSQRQKYPEYEREYGTFVVFPCDDKSFEALSELVNPYLGNGVTYDDLVSLLTSQYVQDHSERIAFRRIGSLLQHCEPRITRTHGSPLRHAADTLRREEQPSTTVLATRRGNNGRSTEDTALSVTPVCGRFRSNL